jgi:hypothetical protein
MKNQAENDRFHNARESNQTASASCLTLRPVPQTGFPRVKSLTAAELVQLVLVLEHPDPAERPAFRVDDDGFVRRRTRGGPIVGKVETVREAVLTTIHAGISVMTREDPETPVGSAHAPASNLKMEGQSIETPTVVAEVAPIPVTSEAKHGRPVGVPQPPFVAVQADVRLAVSPPIATTRSTGAPGVGTPAAPIAVQLIKMVPVAKRGYGSSAAPAPTTAAIHKNAIILAATATPAKPWSIVLEAIVSAGSYFTVVLIDMWQKGLTKSQAIGVGILFAAFSATVIGVWAYSKSR